MRFCLSEGRPQLRSFNDSRSDGGECVCTCLGFGLGECFEKRKKCAAFRTIFPTVESFAVLRITFRVNCRTSFRIGSFYIAIVVFPHRRRQETCRDFCHPVWCWKSF